MPQRSHFKCSISTLGPTKARRVRWSKKQREQMLHLRDKKLPPAQRRKGLAALNRKVKIGDLRDVIKNLTERSK